MTIVNDDSKVVNKLEASLTDDARVIIYDRHMFIVLTEEKQSSLQGSSLSYLFSIWTLDIIQKDSEDSYFIEVKDE